MKKLINLIIFLLFTISCERNIIKPIEAPNAINGLFKSYNKSWSDGDVEDIVENIYGVPFTLHLPTGVVLLKDKSKIRSFLINTFADLEKNNYGYSKFNNWEHVKVSQNVAVVEQNFTRYLKNDSVMLPKNRTASYILGKDDNGKYKIYSIIGHSPLSNWHPLFKKKDLLIYETPLAHKEMQIVK